MRLTLQTEGCNGATTAYGYIFSSTPSIRSYTTTTRTVPADPLGKSDITTTLSKVFMDGLGRTIQTNLVAQTQDGTQDIIFAIEYDKLGRGYKSFEPIALNTTGSFQNPSIFSGAHSSSTYEASPLNRVISSTHSDWHPSTFRYGANISTDNVIKNHSTSSYYPVNELRKHTVIDANENQLITFTDKKGRTILSRRTDKNGANKVDTYTLYDGKDRVTTVLPPQTTISSADLIFTYKYDKEDHVIESKVPGKAKMDYWYNIKDLLGASRNKLLQNRNLWYVYNYDVRGRDSLSGFYNTAPPTSGTFTNLVPSEKLSETIFGTSVFEKIRSKHKRPRCWVLQIHG